MKNKLLNKNFVIRILLIDVQWHYLGINLFNIFHFNFLFFKFINHSVSLFIFIQTLYIYNILLLINLIIRTYLIVCWTFCYFQFVTYTFFNLVFIHFCRKMRTIKKILILFPYFILLIALFIFLFTYIHIPF